MVAVWLENSFRTNNFYSACTVKKLAKLDSIFVDPDPSSYFCFDVFLQQNIVLSSRPKLKFHSHALDIWQLLVTIHSRCTNAGCWTFTVYSDSTYSPLLTFLVCSSHFSLVFTLLATVMGGCVYVTCSVPPRLRCFLENVFTLYFS